MRTESIWLKQNETRTDLFSNHELRRNQIVFRTRTKRIGLFPKTWLDRFLYVSFNDISSMILYLYWTLIFIYKKKFKL